MASSIPHMKGHPLWGLMPRLGDPNIGLELSQYGDIVSFNKGFEKNYSINHPDYIYYVLHQNQHNYHSAQLRRFFSPVSENNLIIAYGDDWRNRRRFMQPSFRQEFVNTFLNNMTEIVQKSLTRCSEESAGQKTISMNDKVIAMSFRIIVKTLFRLVSDDEIEELREISYYSLYPNLFYKFPEFIQTPLWFPKAFNRKVRQAIRRLDQMLEMLFERHHKAGDGLDDLFTFLFRRKNDFGMTNRDLRNEGVALLFAGTETTANSMLFNIYTLGHYHQIRKKAEREIFDVCGDCKLTAENISKLDFLNKAISETLRLYAPLLFINRRALKADKIGPYKIKKNAPIFISPLAVHMSPKYWEKPEVFDPELHFGNSKKIRRGVYIPFGLGGKSCIGKHFSLFETKVFLATLLRDYDWKIVAPTSLELVSLFTLKPKDDIVITIQKKSSAEGS